MIQKNGLNLLSDIDLRYLAQHKSVTLASWELNHTSRMLTVVTTLRPKTSGNLYREWLAVVDPGSADIHRFQGFNPVL